MGWAESITLLEEARKRRVSSSKTLILKVLVCLRENNTNFSQSNDKLRSAKRQESVKHVWKDEDKLGCWLQMQYKPGNS